MITKEKFDYLNVLALDSLYDFLSLYERHLCHLLFLQRTNKTSDKIETARLLINDQNWRPPASIYGQDRVLYMIVENHKIPAILYKDSIEDLVKNHLK